ncbi:hypothetical protein NQ317_019041 [Molorchus minor]|uniref:Uncharacterized protein n=1 Tax=Molorchus minor TaxID=1323400 RepID=A0ABQ9IY41_9CUCU|nr:hypothetical protein NQ317_019041 [Molorchus minor]
MDKERGKRKETPILQHMNVCSHIMYIIYKFFVIVKKIVQLFNIHHYNHYYNKKKGNRFVLRTNYKYKTTVATDKGLRSSINNK